MSLIFAAAVTAGLALAPPPAAGHAAEPLVEVFAPASGPAGTLFQGSFSPDGEEFYFFRKIGEPEDYRLYRTVRRGGEWSDAEQIESAYSDLYPSISPDGRRLVFVSYRPLPGRTLAEHATTLWQRVRTDRTQEWGPPAPVQEATPPDRYVSTLVHRADGSICFRSHSLDYRTTTHNCAAPKGDGYSAPRADDALETWRTRLPEGARLAGGTLSRDGRVIALEVVTGSQATGDFNADIWVSRLPEGASTWTSPVPLPASVNTPGFENFIVFGPGDDLYFVRDFSTYHRVQWR